MKIVTNKEKHHRRRSILEKRCSLFCSSLTSSRVELRPKVLSSVFTGKSSTLMKNFRSNHQKCAIFSQYSHENTCVGVSSCLQLYYKETPTQVFPVKLLRTPILKIICERLLLRFKIHFKFDDLSF